MRNTSICFVLMVALAFSGILYAQEEEPHVYAVVTFELLSPEDGSDAEYDSLGAFWTVNAVKKNEFIVNQILMSHMWGSNSSDFVVITEYKTFADIEKGQNLNFDLIEEAIPDKEERDKYYKEFFKYLGNHSDEIYQGR